MKTSSSTSAITAIATRAMVFDSPNMLLDLQWLRASDRIASAPIRNEIAKIARMCCGDGASVLTARLLAFSGGLGRVASMEIGAIVRMLTPAQKRAVLALDGENFVDYKLVMKQRTTRMALTNGGVTEPKRTGPVTMWSSIRLTPLGLKVKATIL